MSETTETVLNLAPDQRTLTIPGLAADGRYRVEIEAFRVVDQDVDADGVIESTVAVAPASPYQPSPTVSLGDGVLSGGTPIKTIVDALKTNGGQIIQVKELLAGFTDLTATFGNTANSKTNADAAEAAKLVAQAASTNATKAYTDSQAARDAAQAAQGLALGSATTSQQALADTKAARDAAQTAATVSQTSANNASGFASTASGQATIATQKATDAGTSASNASASASTATTQAGTATTQASNALTSANNSLGSANTATTQSAIAATSAGQTLPQYPDAALTHFGRFLVDATVTTKTVTGIGTVIEVAGSNYARLWSLNGITIAPGSRIRFTLGARVLSTSTGIGSANIVMATNQSDLSRVSATTAPTTVATGTTTVISQPVYPPDDVWRETIVEYVTPAIPPAGFLYFAPLIYVGNVSPSRIVQVRYFRVEDVTSENAAKGAATASAGSASTAGTKADAASVSASAALASQTAANTSAGNASTAAAQASTSATNASGSANSAVSSATVAASSATASTLTAATLLPSTFENNGQFFARPSPIWAGAPNTLASIVANSTFTFPVIDGVGIVMQVNNPATGEFWITPIGVIKAVAGATYRWTVTGRSTPDSVNQVVRSAVAYLKADYTVLSTVGTINSTNTANWTTMVATVKGDDVIAAGGVYIRGGVIAANGRNNQWSMLKLEDVSDAVNALTAANASAASASSAAASKTGADQAASAANTSKTDAQTAAGNASTSASQASTSASNASGSANTASTQANLASTAKTGAETAKSGAEGAQQGAAGSASSANTSASIASSKADAAGTSATAANQSKLDAQAASGAAQGSAQAASASQVSATAAASSASASAMISSSYSSASININDKFGNWQGEYPSGWSVWAAGGNYRIDRQPGLGSAYGLRTLNDTPNVDSGFGQAVTLHKGMWVMEATVMKQGGTWSGSGMSISGAVNYNFASEADTNGVIASNSDDGTVRTWSKMFRYNGEFGAQATLYGMVGYGGFGGRDPKYLIWYALRVRPATAGEIAGNKALADSATNTASISSLQSTVTNGLGSLATRADATEAKAATFTARVATTEGALATIAGRTEAYLVQDVSAGNGRAIVSLRANGVSGSSNIDIAASQIRLINSSGGVLAPTLSVQGGNVSISGDLFMGTGRIVSQNGNFMKVQGSGFGSSNQFLEWYGPTRSTLEQCTESIAITYLRTDGQAFFGGMVAEGQLRSVKTTTELGLSQVANGPLVTNGRTRAWTAGISVRRSGRRVSTYTGPSGWSATFVIEQLVGGNWVQKGDTGNLVGYTYDDPNNGYATSSEPAGFTQSASGSVSFNDTTGGTNPFQVRARILSLSTPAPSGSSGGAGDAFTQVLTINTYEV